jgi:hypothetical protein
LTDQCLSFVVKGLNFPRRVRNVHLPLSKIVECRPGLAFGKNSFHVVTKDGEVLVFIVYGAVPIDILPVYQELHDEWIATIRESIDAGVESPPCANAGPRFSRNDRNPQALVFLIWCVLMLPTLVVLAIVGTDYGIVAMVFGACFLGLWLALRQMPSG